MSIVEKSGTKFLMFIWDSWFLCLDSTSLLVALSLLLSLFYNLLSSFLLLKSSALLFIIFVIVKHHSSPWCQWAIYISRGIPMRYKEYKSSPNQFTNRKTNYIFSNTSKSHFICKTICKMKSLDSVILKILSCFEDLVNI